MKKINCRIVLCIGMLSFNILSSCTRIKQNMHMGLKKVTCGIMEKITYPNIPRNLVKNKRTLSTNPVPFKGGLFTFDPLLIEDFKPSKSVVTCYVVCNRRILLLKRNHLTDAGSTWCTPGGKLEQNETPLQAIIRETEEETGILLLPEETKLMKTIGVRIFVPKQDYLLHLFKAVLPKSQPSDYSVVLNQEHTDYLWIDPEEAKQLHLVPGGKEMLKSNLLGVFSEKGK